VFNKLLDGREDGAARRFYAFVSRYAKKVPTGTFVPATPVAESDRPGETITASLTDRQRSEKGGRFPSTALSPHQCAADAAEPANSPSWGAGGCV
jgi:hypothetical protein